MKVDFLCVGAGKAGTTWIADKLRQHPQIFIPQKKEIGYFNRFMPENRKLKNLSYSKGVEWYHSHFSGAESYSLRGESSPAYLKCNNCATDIYSYNCSMKIIIILRDPLERCLSEYKYWVQRGVVENNGLKKQLAGNSTLVVGSMYYKQVKNYFHVFPRENICVLFYDDLKDDPYSVYSKLTSFLGVSDYFPQGLCEKSNVTSTPKIARINRIISSLRFYIRSNERLHFMPRYLELLGLTRLAEKILKFNSGGGEIKYVFDVETLERLNELFNKDIEKLEHLLSVDLSGWRNRYTSYL